MTISTTANDDVFHAFGVLEHIFSYSTAKELAMASEVNKRWKIASRNDLLWLPHSQRLWNSKVAMQDVTMFWRTLLTKDAIHRLGRKEIHQILQHPLVKAQLSSSGIGGGNHDGSIEHGRSCNTKTQETSVITTSNGSINSRNSNSNNNNSNSKAMTDTANATKPQPAIDELRHQFRVHMLDVVANGPKWNCFFDDIRFGSYACSVMDSRRDCISLTELCTPHGFAMYFKISADDVEDDDDRSLLLAYEESDEYLLYHHSTCYFHKTTHQFSLILNHHAQSYQPTQLLWRWVDDGKRVQVGPYPPLRVTRRADWGWKLENTNVVLLFQDEKMAVANEIGNGREA